MASYDYNGAIQAGANPTDVMNYMASQTGYNAQGAVQAGANPQDVMSYMATLPQSQSSGGLVGKVGSAIAGIPDDIKNIFPNQNLGKIIGTPLGGILTAITNPGALHDYDWNPHASAAGVASDIGGDALNAASLLAAPETGGTSLAARAAVNAAIGGGLNLANSLSNGQSITDPGVLKNAAGAATLSSVLPVLAEPLAGFMGAVKEASGVTPQIETALKGSTPAEIQEYVKATIAHNSDLNTPTATGLVAQKLNDATDVITQKLKTAGQAIGNAIKLDGSKTIGTNPQTSNNFTDDILSSFNKKVEDTFGHEITSTGPATTKMNIGGQTVTDAGQLSEPELSPLPGRSRTIAPADQGRILSIHNQLMDLADNPTVAKASDIIKNIDDLIDWSKVDKVGVNHDPLQGIIRSTAGEINDALRDTSPAVAAANDRWSQLKNIENEIGEKAGSDMQRSALVMRRVFSGDQSGKSLQLLNDIKNETGIDLVKHSALAKFATDTFGNDSSRSLLQQELNQGGSMLGGMKRALIAPLKSAARSLLVPNAEKYATRIASGGKYATMLDELLNSNAGQNLSRTYFNNVSAAHPQIGSAIDRMLSNLIGNTIGR